MNTRNSSFLCLINKQTKNLSPIYSLYTLYILIVQLRLDEVVTEGFCLRTQPITASIVQNFLIGEYSLYWQRLVSSFYNSFLSLELSSYIIVQVIQIFLNYVQHFRYLILMLNNDKFLLK